MYNNARPRDLTVQTGHWHKSVDLAHCTLMPANPYVSRAYDRGPLDLVFSDDLPIIFDPTPTYMAGAATLVI